MKHSKQIIATIMVIMVISVTMSAISVTPNVSAQEVTPFPSREKILSVTGNAFSSVDPDLANISFGVEIQEKTANAALTANSELMSKVIASIKQVGISDSEISTSQFSIYPVYDYYQEKETGSNVQKLVGYKVSNMIIVKTDKLDSVAAIIDNAVNSGVNRVDNVFFSLSPEVQSTLKDELLGKAVLDAKSKAQLALSALNYKIIGVKAVSLSEFSMPYQQPMYAMQYDGMMAKSSAPTQIFSSDQQVSTSVNVVFLIGTN
ncbi:MAG: SIMPL domain-containing protein [Nitrosarchaeum sp.]|nr:SIMPL domain-containing protein [Nitrosarchaeum sp.]MDW7641070.1 SIMPL domain-containing protein [Nitrosarchaeum sp.]